MGKRNNKSNGSALESPTKGEKKPRLEKPADSDNSVSEPDDDEEEHHEMEETRIEEGQGYYEPDELKRLVESFNEFISRNGSTTTVHGMEKLVGDWTKEREELIDVGIFMTDYRRFLKAATKYRNFHIADASAALVRYLESEKSLGNFTSFPEKPLSKVQLYIKKHNIETKNFNELQNAHKRMKKDVEGCREIDEQIRELSVQYIPQLQKFLDTHPNISDEQKRFIKNKIKLVSKRFIAKDSAPKTPKKKSKKKEEETAYSLYCRSMFDKYRDLSENERERKLQRKFRRLPEESLAIYENLVLSYK